jgi:predicted nuclease of predicted toxin-antitoxin system
LLHRILVDESVDIRIANKRRKENYNIISIVEKYRSIPDKEVLKLAQKYEAVLLTEDSDFGEWVFSHKKKGFGVIFLRYKHRDIEKIMNSLLLVLDKHKDTLFNKFAVIKTTKIRIREI